MAPTGVAGLICLAWEEAGVRRSGRPAGACHPFNDRKEMALTIASDTRHHRRCGHPRRRARRRRARPDRRAARSPGVPGHRGGLCLPAGLAERLRDVAWWASRGPAVTVRAWLALSPPLVSGWWRWTARTGRTACGRASPTPSTRSAPPASRCVAPSTSTCPGAAAACTREAVFTASPATMPSPTAPSETATSPVTTPARAARPGSPDSAPSWATAATRSSPDRTARSASPSAATGVPHTAITASPMNFSTTPPYRVITVRATPKYSDSSSRTASGSRASDRGVNPATSQNSTEQTRRSATGPAAAPAPGGAASVPDGAGGRPDSWCPQERQNGFPGVTGSPHDGHRLRGAPQSWQNRSPSPWDAPHRGHVTTTHLYPRPAPGTCPAPATAAAHSRPAGEFPGGAQNWLIPRVDAPNDPASLMRADSARNPAGQNSDHAQRLRLGRSQCANIRLILHGSPISSEPAPMTQIG